MFPFRPSFRNRNVLIPGAISGGRFCFPPASLWIWLLIQKLEDLHLLRLDSCFEKGKGTSKSIHEYQPAIRCLAGAQAAAV